MKNWSKTVLIMPKHFILKNLKKSLFFLGGGKVTTFQKYAFSIGKQNKFSC